MSFAGSGQSMFELVVCLWPVLFAFILVVVLIFGVPVGVLKKLDQKRGLKLGVAIVIGFIAFIRLTYVFAQYEVGIKNIYVRLTGVSNGIVMYSDDQTSIYREIWFRDIIPPFGDGCFTDDRAVCKNADAYENYDKSQKAAIEPKNLGIWFLEFIGKVLMLGLPIGLLMKWLMDWLIETRITPDESG